MSIVKPFTFTAGTKARANEVNDNFDILYSQVNSNITEIENNAEDIDELTLNKANINGNSTQRFAVADPISNSDAINKQTMFGYLGNTLDYISGLVISKNSGNPNKSILVTPGAAYDSTHSIVLKLTGNTTKTNTTQAANATYYVYIIGNATGSSIDILISTTNVNPTLPSGYTLYRLIGYYTTNSSSNISYVGYYGNNVTSDNSVSSIGSKIMPKISAGVSISSGYTAPSSGWLYIKCSANNSSQSALAYINNVEVYGFKHNDGYAMNCGCMIPIAAGQTFTVNNNGWDVLKFFPSNGV